MGFDPGQRIDYTDVALQRLARYSGRRDFPVRVRAIIRESTQMDPQRFAAYLGPDWLSMLPDPSGQHPEYTNRLIEHLRAKVGGIPVYGRVLHEDFMEELLGIFWRSERMREPLQFKGHYRVPKLRIDEVNSRVGCLYLSELERNAGSVDLFTKDREFLHPTKPVLALDVPSLSTSEWETFFTSLEKTDGAASKDTQ